MSEPLVVWSTYAVWRDGFYLVWRDAQDLQLPQSTDSTITAVCSTDSRKSRQRGESGIPGSTEQ